MKSLREQFCLFLFQVAWVSIACGLLALCRAGGRAQGIATRIYCVLLSRAARVFLHLNAVLRGGEEFKFGFVFIGVNFGSKVTALACALAEA